MMDDCSRVITGAQLYAREALLAYFDFLPRAFKEYGLPLLFYVDYHSFFFSQNPWREYSLSRRLMNWA